MQWYFTTRTTSDIKILCVIHHRKLNSSQLVSGAQRTGQWNPVEPAINVPTKSGSWGGASLILRWSFIVLCIVFYIHQRFVWSSGVRGFGVGNSAHLSYPQKYWTLFSESKVGVKKIPMQGGIYFLWQQTETLRLRRLPWIRYLAIQDVVFLLFFLEPVVFLSRHSSCHPFKNNLRFCFPVLRTKCKPNPCMNGGSCTDLNGGFECACSFGYKGETCDRKNKYTCILIHNVKHYKQRSIQTLFVPSRASRFSILYPC